MFIQIAYIVYTSLMRLAYCFSIMSFKVILITLLYDTPYYPNYTSRSTLIIMKDFRLLLENDIIKSG